MRMLDAAGTYVGLNFPDSVSPSKMAREKVSTASYQGAIMHHLSQNTFLLARLETGRDSSIRYAFASSIQCQSRKL